MKPVGLCMSSSLYRTFNVYLLDPQTPSVGNEIPRWRRSYHPIVFVVVVVVFLVLLLFPFFSPSQQATADLPAVETSCYLVIISVS